MTMNSLLENTVINLSGTKRRIFNFLWKFRVDINSSVTQNNDFLFPHLVHLSAWTTVTKK